MAVAPVRLVVLYGGQSAEHEISCISAAHVLAALDPDRYEIDAVAITRDGRWMRSRSLERALRSDERVLPASLPASLGDPISADDNDDDGDGVELDPRPVLTETDGRPVVVLPVLHGPRGEDGTVQGLLELLDVAYVGSGVLGSALNMDKAMAKTVAAAAGLPIVAHLAVRDIEVSPESSGFDELVQRVGAELGWPVFVKPANMGSSVGVSRATDPAELAAAVQTATSLDEWVVIEAAVSAREVEVGVIGNHEPKASVVGEIVPTHDFYDYEDKYLDGAAEMVVPADLPVEVAEEARRLAVEAYKALRCDGLARVDFFYEEQRGDGRPGRGLLFNEINTMPGFTPYSMFPSLWAAAGLNYGALLDKLIDLALARHQHRTRHRLPH
ncbi:MAG: D-alanine--D-alanine ligase [Microthrixaceae bacterium]|jgi:D-alanine-D-alanine ligase|nr:D-alanine--D-alanine ligase [Microthrixaceae bacterium]